MSQLHIALLGMPEIRHNEQILTFPTRKTLALFLYLIVEGGMHSREKLATLFWPESDSAHSRGALRYTLAYLRAALREKANENTSHMHVERLSLGVDMHSALEVDCWRVHSAFLHAHSSSGKMQYQVHEQQSTILQLQAAFACYRGPFLEGFSLGDAPAFDDWVGVQRNTWHQRLSTILNRLVQLQMDNGDLITAVENASAWVTHDPLNEIAYQQLMSIQVALGERDAALRTYTACQTLLARELNISPAEEITELAERIRRGEGIHHTQQTTFPSLGHHSSFVGPLVGRRDAYTMLTQQYHQISQGQSHCVILEGEAGIGKTRLATDFLAWAMTQDAEVLYGQAFESGGHLPYQPLVEALRTSLKKHENVLDGLLSDVLLAELIRILPELRVHYPHVPSFTQDDAVARIRLFEAIMHLSRVLAMGKPLVLFIDDVHWTDAISLDVLQYLGRRWQEEQVAVLLLVSLRSEELHARQAVTTWLSTMERSLPMTRLPLKRLSYEETVHLVQQVEDAHQRENKEAKTIPQVMLSQAYVTREETLGEWVFRETQGNPFYVLETLTALLDKGLLTSHPLAPGTWMHDFAIAVQQERTLHHFLPPRIEMVIRSRILSLTPTALKLLMAGAVLGDDFTFEQLCFVADVAEDIGLQALDEVVQRHVLCIADLGRGQMTPECYLFTHEKIRDVVYTEAGETRRRLFHQRAFLSLQVSGFPPATLAYHALRAKLAEPAFHLSIAAGEAAMQVFALQDAIAFYEQARQVATALEDVTPQHTHRRILEQQHLFLRLGRTYELVVSWEQAKTVYQNMLTFAREVHNPGMECKALTRLAVVLTQQAFDVNLVKALLLQARQVATASGNVEGRAETAWHLAQLGGYARDLADYVGRGEQALQMAHNLGVIEQFVDGANGIALSNVQIQRWEEIAVHQEDAIAYAEEASQLYATLGDYIMEINTCCLLATACVQGGRPQPALSAARAAHALSVRIDNTWGRVYSTLPLSWSLQECGEYEQALEIAQEGVTKARTMDNRQLLCRNLAALGFVYEEALLQGENAYAAYQEALTLNRTFPGQPYEEVLTAKLCAACILLDKWEEAYAYALKAIAARSKPVTLLTGATRWYETQALLRQGDMKHAEEDIQIFGRRIGENKRYRIPYLRSLAVLAQWQGERENAVKHLQAAHQLAEAIGVPSDQWQIDVALGELYHLNGKKERADWFFARAAMIVRELTKKMRNGSLQAHFLLTPQVQSLFVLTQKAMDDQCL